MNMSTIIHAKVAAGAFLSLKITVSASNALIIYTAANVPKESVKKVAMLSINSPYYPKPVYYMIFHYIMFCALAP